MIRFEDSLAALAQIARKETGATGYALFQRTSGISGLTRIAAIGEEIQTSVLDESNQGRIIFLPLHTNGAVDGWVSFSFASRKESDAASELLHQIVAAMETIWAARNSEAYYLTLARRLSALESRLIDSKIVDRAQGLLHAEPPSDVVDSLVHHVRTVLQPSPAARTLEALLQDLEKEVEARRITGQAKALLQATHSLSEDQAYAHLRTLSRRSRRRLSEVAADVMEQHTLGANTVWKAR